MVIDKNGRNYRDSLVNIFSVERSSQESRGFSHERFNNDKQLKTIEKLQEANLISNKSILENHTKYYQALRFNEYLKDENYGYKFKTYVSKSYNKPIYKLKDKMKSIINENI